MKQLSKIYLFLKKQLLIHSILTRWLVISTLVNGLLLQISDADDIASTAKYFMTVLVPGKSKSFSSDSVKASFSRIKDSNKKGDCETKRSNCFHLLFALIFLLLDWPEWNICFFNRANSTFHPIALCPTTQFFNTHVSWHRKYRSKKNVIILSNYSDSLQFFFGYSLKVLLKVARCLRKAFQVAWETLEIIVFDAVMLEQIACGYNQLLKERYVIGTWPFRIRLVASA